MSIGVKIQFALVIVTCCSIIVPLIIQFIKYIIFRPRISIITDINSDELFSECTLIDSSTKIDTISFKIRIRNNGRKSAENVQIIVSKVEFENKKGTQSPRFPPLKLYWSYQDDRITHDLLPLTMKKIQPKSFEDCDFLFLNKQNKYGYFAAINSKFLINEYGRYTIKLIISGDNFNSFEKSITFTFNPNNEHFIQDLS